MQMQNPITNKEKPEMIWIRATGSFESQLNERIQDYL